MSNYNTLFKGSSRKSGRSHTGQITCWHRGALSSAHRGPLFRIVDFLRKDMLHNFFVHSIEYDPFRTGRLALVSNSANIFLGNFKFVLAAEGLAVGKYCTDSAGFTMPLQNIAVGSFVFCVEKKFAVGGVFARAAGCFAQIIQKFNTKIFVKLPSGQVHTLFPLCKASFGRVSNSNHYLRVLGKAGVSRWLGSRPVTRGVAINPIDHPHGGGEGKSQVGRPSVTPWGRLTKGKKTVYK